MRGGGRRRLAPAAAALAVALAGAPAPAAGLDRAATLEEARARRDAGDLDGALDLWSSILAADPRDHEVAVERARVLAWKGELVAAENALLEVLAARPDAVEARAVLADARLWRGDERGARSVLEEGLDHAPAAAPLRSRLAALEYRGGRVGGARAELRRALASDPALPDGPRRLSLYSAWLVELRAGTERLSGDRADWTDLGLEVEWRPAAPWTARVGVERVSRFGRSETVALARVARALSDRLSVSAGVRASPGAEVVPRRGVTVGATARPDGRWVGEIEARLLDFEAGTARVARAGVSRAMGRQWELGVSFAWTEDPAGHGDTGHAVRALWAPSTWTAVQVEWFRGTDVEGVQSAGTSTTTTTDGVVAAWRLHPAPGWGVRLHSGWADRRGDYRRASAGASLVRYL